MALHPGVTEGSWRQEHIHTYVSPSGGTVSVVVTKRGTVHVTEEWVDETLRELGFKLEEEKWPSTVDTSKLANGGVIQADSDAVPADLDNGYIIPKPLKVELSEYDRGLLRDLARMQITIPPNTFDHQGERP